MKSNIIISILFLFFLAAHAYIASQYNVTMVLWWKIQILNIGLYLLLWGGLLIIIRKTPQMVGFVFMGGLMVLILLFKWGSRILFKSATLLYEQEIMLATSFLLYMLYTLSILVSILKNLKINDEKK